MLIDVKNVTFAYYDSAEPVFENLYLQLDTDWKLGLIGRNGYGKTTFLNLLQNKLEYSGQIISPDLGRAFKLYRYYFASSNRKYDFKVQPYGYLGRTRQKIQRKSFYRFCRAGKNLRQISGA